jgi:hypothetical protein
MHARHQRARALLAIGGRSAAAAAGDEIQRALALVEKTGGRSFEPRLHRELAELARLRGDETTRQHELRAERVIAEIGGPEETAASLTTPLSSFSFHLG